MSLTFRYTILYVDDVPRQMALYEQGLGLERRMLHPSNQYGELCAGPTRLSFSARSLMESLGHPPGRADAHAPTFEIAFEVPADEVEGACARAIEAGFLPMQPPTTQPWGQITAYVADPNEGFLIEICSPVTGQS